MESFVRPQDIETSRVTEYPGLLACLVFSTAHKKFHDTIKDNWGALDYWSGEPVSILATDAKQSRKQKVPRAVHRRSGTESYKLHHMLSLPGNYPGGVDQVNVHMAHQLGVPLPNMPCIVFFNKIKEPTTHIYSFAPSTDVVNCMMRVFQRCKEVYSCNYRGDDESLEEFRLRLMNELEPLLNRERIFRLINKISQNQLFGSVFGGLVSR